MMFWSVGPFWYMVYGIWYVVYGMKMAFTVYSHMFRVRHARAVYNVVHLFLVLIIFLRYKRTMFRNTSNMENARTTLIKLVDSAVQANRLPGSNSSDSIENPAPSTSNMISASTSSAASSEESFHHKMKRVR